MIKSFHAFVEKEGLLGMTFFAVLSEFVFVYILVAGRTIAKLQSAEPLNGFAIQCFGFVAFYTADKCMLTQQRETGFAVIETFCIFP